MQTKTRDEKFYQVHRIDYVLPLGVFLAPTTFIRLIAMSYPFLPSPHIRSLEYTFGLTLKVSLVGSCPTQLDADYSYSNDNEEDDTETDLCRGDSL